MLIVLYNAMTDLTLSDEFRNFILNAFLQPQFSEDSLNTLYKLGLHNSLLQIIENYTIENEFDGCFTVKPKFEVTETVVEESESDEEYDRDCSKKKKHFSTKQTVSPSPGCSYYSPPSSSCSSRPLSRSSDVFQSYDYASEPESED
jgi:hypothetical protein